MIRELAIFERSSCRCTDCAGPCRGGKPGVLAPSDLDSIADYLGLDEASPEFIKKMFHAAADGPSAPTLEFPSGETPALRPATRPDGTCVFLGADGDCTIHPVAPFECGRVNQCSPADGAAAMRALGVSITRSVDYVQMWWWLRKRQNVAEPAK